MYLLLWHREAYTDSWKNGDEDHYNDLYNCIMCKNLCEVYTHIARIKWDVNFSKPPERYSWSLSLGKTKDEDFQILKVDEELGPSCEQLNLQEIDKAYTAVINAKSEEVKQRQKLREEEALKAQEIQEKALLAKLKEKYE